MDQKKVKAVWFNDPSRTREFTKVAFDMVTHPQGWVLADNQEGVGVEKKTAPAVAPAAIADHNKRELELARDEYRKASGKEPELSWNEPKLFIETQKALKLKASQPVIDEVSIVETGAPEEIADEVKEAEKPAKAAKAPKAKKEKTKAPEA